jgi:iron complex outermembrane receptor protein
MGRKIAIALVGNAAAWVLASGAAGAQTSVMAPTAAAQDGSPQAQSATTAPSAPAISSPTAPVPDQPLADSGDIIVTAQRRSENAQKTSLAVTALSGAELTQRGVRDLQDLQNVSPSLSFADAGLLKFANIRGVGLNLQSPTVVGGVATYRDGLFAPSPIFLNEGLFDIASVEVLRGPQGTFVGQNSTGGAIIQKTQSPELGRTDANGELTLGNYNLVKADAGLSLPIGETLALRVAGEVERRDSFYTNLGPLGNAPGRVREEHGRVSLLWQPASNFTALLKSEVNFGNDGGYPASPIPGTLYAPLDPAAPFTFNYDRTDVRRKEFSSRTGLELNYTTGGGVVIRSISGYQYGYQDFINDNDGTSAPELYQHQQIHDNVYSTELNIISPDRGRFKWVVGGSYVYQTAQLFLHIYNARAPFNGQPFATQDTFIDTTNPKTALGLFAQGTYRFTDTLSLDLGGRFSHDIQTQTGALTLSPVPPLPGRLDASQPHYEDNRWTGKAALNWQLTPNHLLYAFVANGFKSGGVNLPDGVFKPESITDVEAGWKGTLGGGLLRLQLNGFYMDYNDLQLNIFNLATAGSTIANAGKSTIYGAEAQAQLRAGGFSATGNLSYVHSSLGQLSQVDVRALPNGTAQGLGVQCPTGVASNPPLCFNYTPYIVSLDGRQNPYSPRWTVSGDARYTFQVGDRQTLTPQVDIAYLSNQTTSIFERPVLDVLAARTLVGVQLTYGWRNWTLTGYATNLFDKRYRIGNDGNNTYFGAPRQFGVRIGGRL